MDRISAMAFRLSSTAKRATAVRRTILIQVWTDDGLQCFQGRAVVKRERMPPSACLNGEEQPNRCGYSPAQMHRRNAHGVVRNTVKHTSTRKVAVARIEGSSGLRQAHKY